MRNLDNKLSFPICRSAARFSVFFNAQRNCLAVKFSLKDLRGKAFSDFHGLKSVPS